jgi:hypothetical protein
MFLRSGSDGSKEGPVLPPPYQEGDGLHFPGAQPNGLTPRLQIQIDEAEFELYRDATRS